MRKLALTSLVAVAAILILAAVALAATWRPKDGTWKVTSHEGGFKVTDGGKKVSGIHFDGSKFPTTCQPGPIKISGTFKLRKGRDHSWLLGQPQSSGIGVAVINVNAEQNGTNPGGAQMFIAFNTNGDDPGYFSDNDCSFNFAVKK